MLEVVIAVIFLLLGIIIGLAAGFVIGALVLQASLESVGVIDPSWKTSRLLSQGNQKVKENR